MPIHRVKLFAFGPFEVNSGSGEIVKNGEAVKLQEQPFRVLLVLLENARRVVTREELRSHIWAEDTYVDFDGSLRVAIRKLRDALGDDVDHSQYIETVRKRGYRFLALPVITEIPTEAVPDGTPNTPEPTPRPPAHRERGAVLADHLRWISVAAVILVVSAVATLPSVSRSPSGLTEGDTVVLADFRNSTGEPVFDDTLREGMAVQLQQSPFLSVLSDERTAHFLQLMGRPPTEHLTPALARDVCERSGSSAVLNGSIANVGTEYVLALQTTSCSNGTVLDQEQARAAKKEGVLDALDQIARRFRTRIGESAKTLQTHDLPLAEATTPSLNALKAYSTGWKISASIGETDSIPFFKQAIELDPQFAAAYAALGLMYGSTGESELASVNASKAYELRARASDNEKFFITAYYQGRVTGNQQKAAQTCEAWQQAYPREPGPHHFLSGFIYPVLGKYERSVAEGEAGLRLDPISAIGYLMLAYDYVYLNRLDKAQEVLDAAHQRHVQIPYFSVLRYDLAFLREDNAAMDREAASARRETGAEDWIADHQGFVLAYGGRLREAEAMSHVAEDLSGQAGHRERAALFAAGAAEWEALLGHEAKARRDAATALALASDREVEYGSAVALILAGRASEGKKLADDLASRFPEDTSVHFSYLPVLHALAALKHREPDKAIQVLAPAAENDFSTPRSNLQGFFGELFPVFVRGQAYLAAHRAPQAAAEFQKIIDHRSIVISDPVGALAYLQLARASAISHDSNRARSSYREFLHLWKDADSDLALLHEARDEYAALR